MAKFCISCFPKMFGHIYNPRSKADLEYFAENEVCGGCGQAHLERKKVDTHLPVEASVQASKPEVISETVESVEPSISTTPLTENNYINQILQGDCLELLKNLPDNSVDAVVTDPPYELGFMGREWDKSGIAYNINLWNEVLRVLKSGGHLLSFGGSRTYHRMAGAIEDAGFEIRDMVEWCYGSGFPKSMDISKAIDKLRGVERKVIGRDMVAYRPNAIKAHKEGQVASFGLKPEGSGLITEPASEEAKEWDGWGTALKPAHEPIILARKPLSEKTVVWNVLKWGVGGLNIDGCRVDFLNDADRKESTDKNQHADFGSNNGVKVPTKGIYHGDFRPPENYNPNKGRFPSNFIHDGSDEVLAEFAKAGESISRIGKPRGTSKKGLFANSEFNKVGQEHNDSGTPARFFYQAKASNSERWFYCHICKDAFPNEQRSAHKHEKPDDDQTHIESHPTQKPKALMKYLVKLLTREGQIVLDPFDGSGSTAVACVELCRQFIGFDLSFPYCEIARKRIANAKKEVESGQQKTD